jgi:hypothetical protein
MSPIIFQPIFNLDRFFIAAKVVLVSLFLKETSMKRKLFYVAALILITISFNSCDKSCKVCKEVFYDKNGNFTREDAEAEYCGVELLAIDGKTVDLGVLGTGKWSCR